MEILNIQQWIENGSDFGSGYGFGGGSGAGDGADIKFFCGSPVYLIDRIPTIITAVFGSYAKGYILEPCLTLTPCYIAKQESHFAHGKTLSEAVVAVAEKAFEDMPEEDRIAEFWKCHEKGVKYPARDLYDWHHRLTGSCEMGRNTFAAEHGIDLNSDMFTVAEDVIYIKQQLQTAVTILYFPVMIIAEHIPKKSMQLRKNGVKKTPHHQCRMMIASDFSQQ